MVQDDEKKIQKVIDHAVGWVASTHKYFSDFLKDINELKILLDKHAGKKLVARELHEALRNFRRAGRYISRISRLNRFTDKLEEFKLDELYPSKEAMAVLGTDFSSLNLSQMAEEGKRLQELRNRINVEGRHLVRMASFFEGEMRKKLDEIEALAKQYEDLRGNKNEWDLSADEEKKLGVVESQTKSKFEELYKVVTEADKWNSALSSDLNSAKAVYRDFRIKQVVTPKQIGDIISRYDDPRDKIKHLALFLNPKAKGAFSTAVNLEVKRLLGTMISQSYDAPFFWSILEVYEKAGMVDDYRKHLKKKYEVEKARGKLQEDYERLERLAFILREKGEHSDAGDCFIEAERNMVKFHQAQGASWCYEEAAKEYTQAGRKGYKEVGIKLMKLARLEKEYFSFFSYAGVRGRPWKDYYYSLAADIFQKGNLFELEGDVWLERGEEAAKDVFYALGNAIPYFKLAITAFEKAGKGRKAYEVRERWLELTKKVLDQMEPSLKRRYQQDWSLAA